MKYVKKVINENVKLYFSVKFNYSPIGTNKKVAFISNVTTLLFSAFCFV